MVAFSRFHSESVRVLQRNTTSRIYFNELDQGIVELANLKSIGQASRLEHQVRIDVAILSLKSLELVIRLETLAGFLYYLFPKAISVFCFQCLHIIRCSPILSIAGWQMLFIFTKYVHCYFNAKSLLSPEIVNNENQKSGKRTTFSFYIQEQLPPSTCNPIYNSIERHLK